MFLLFAAGALFVLGGCSHMPVHYGQIENYPASNDYQPVDDPAPEEELCTLVINGTLYLSGIEGTDRSWRGSLGPGFAYYLKIAAGERTLTFDFSATSSRESGNYIITTTSSADAVNVRYEFEPGHIYTVYPMVNRAENSVSIGIEETSFPVRFGWRMGPYVGWQQGSANSPFGGLFALVQAGFTLPAGNSLMEFLAEANAGVGYSPFKKESSVYVAPEDGVKEDSAAFVDIIGLNAQAGGTANFYFGKSEKKTGFGLGGGLGLGSDGSNVVTIPYIRASFLPSKGDFWIMPSPGKIYGNVSGLGWFSSFEEG
jgi:hypothetical protein